MFASCSPISCFYLYVERAASESTGSEWSAARKLTVLA
jgi:hypothetical protein